MMFRLPITETVLLRAVEIAREHRLRAADAVHLATAMDWREDLALSGERVVFVASDLELLAAAEAAGFTVLNPART
jgi:predicted nucleic acid-binding protein